jgi:hypothetical protein
MLFTQRRSYGFLRSSHATGPMHRLTLLRTERFLAEPRAKYYANARACGSEPLSFVALLGDVPVTAASLGHVCRLLPPALGVAFYPHVHELLGSSVAAALATFETAPSSSASAHIVPSLWLSQRNSTRGVRRLTCSTAQSSPEEAAPRDGGVGGTPAARLLLRCASGRRKPSRGGDAPTKVYSPECVEGGFLRRSTTDGESKRANLRADN